MASEGSDKRNWVVIPATARTGARQGTRGFYYLPDDSVSVELSDAPAMCVPTSVTEWTSRTGRRISSMPLAQMRVLAWLRQHQSEIIAAENQYRVDRRAIAGAIAWEALFNVRGSVAKTFGRFVGPGKAHVRTQMFNPWSTDDTLIKQVEDAQWLPEDERLPSVSDDRRAQILEAPSGAIRYMAASMNAAAHIAEQQGFSSLRNRPEILAFFWQKRDLKTWREHLRAKPAGSAFTTGPDPTEDMDRWVADNLLYLNDAVGQPQCSFVSRALSQTPR